MKVGFIGVGNMGNPMAANLQKAGHTLQVYDIKREAAQNLLDAGATWVNSPKEAATGVSTVFLSLPMPADVERVVLSDNGVLTAMNSGGIIVDMSTNSPSVVRSLAEKTKAKGVTFIDAPVSGGVRGAQTTTTAPSRPCLSDWPDGARL